MPVDRTVARTAAAFGYVGSGIKMLSRAFFYAPLFVLGGSSHLSAFNQAQLETIAYLLIRIKPGRGDGVHLLRRQRRAVGYRMVRAPFLPRVLGVLRVVGGAGWLAYLSPPLAGSLFVPIALVALIGCAVTIGWLMVRGVDEAKWYEMAAVSATSTWR